MTIDYYYWLLCICALYAWPLPMPLLETKIYFIVVGWRWLEFNYYSLNCVVIRTPYYKFKPFFLAHIHPLPTASNMFESMRWSARIRLIIQIDAWHFILTLNPFISVSIQFFPFFKSNVKLWVRKGVIHSLSQHKNFNSDYQIQFVKHLNTL